MLQQITDGMLIAQLGRGQWECRNSADGITHSRQRPLVIVFSLHTNELKYFLVVLEFKVAVWVSLPA